MAKGRGVVLGGKVGGAPLPTLRVHLLCWLVPERGLGTRREYTGPAQKTLLR